MSEIPQNTGEIQATRDVNGKFIKGVSGNPAGKPLGARSFTSKVKEALEKIAEGKDYSYEEAFIKAILKKSIIDQDTRMMRTVWEQLDGKPLQRIANADGSNLMPIPILNISNVLPNNIDEKNNSTEQEN